MWSGDSIDIHIVSTGGQDPGLLVSSESQIYYSIWPSSMINKWGGKLQSGHLGDTDASSRTLGIYEEHSKRLEIKGWSDLVSVYSKLVLSRVSPSPTTINLFLLLKGVMISALSGSLVLGAIAMKKEKKKVRKELWQKQDSTLQTRWLEAVVISQLAIMFSAIVGTQWVILSVSKSERVLERSKMRWTFS